MENILDLIYTPKKFFLELLIGKDFSPVRTFLEKKDFVFEQEKLDKNVFFARHKNRLLKFRTYEKKGVRTIIYANWI